MFYLLRNSPILCAPAIYSMLVCSFVLYHIFHKNKKTIMFWLVICLASVVIISTVAIFLAGPYWKILSFLVLCSSYVLLFILMLILTITNWKRGELESSHDDDTISEMFKHPGRKRLISFSILLLFGFSQLSVDSFSIFSDIPNVVSGHYSTMKGDLGSWGNHEGDFTFFVNDKTEDFFMVSAKDFNTAKEGTIYTVEYLPHSKYVVNILDQSGTSMLK